MSIIEFQSQQNVLLGLLLSMVHMHDKIKEQHNYLNFDVLECKRKERIEVLGINISVR